MSLKRAVQTFFLHQLTFYAVALVFGAPIFSMVVETLIFSSLLSALVSVPLLHFCATEHLHTLDLFVVNKPQKYEQAAQFIILLTLFGAWIGSVAIPLDWDVWWQVWPISNCIAMSLFSLISWILNYTLLRRYPRLKEFFSTRKNHA